MKLRPLQLAGLVLICLSTTPAARAALVVNNLDLILGFAQSGNTTADYVINIGPASIFRDATAPITLSINGANFNADMTTAFSPGQPGGWKTPSSTIYWGAFTTSRNDTSAAAPDNLVNLMYSTKGVAIGAPQATKPTSTAGQSGPSANMVSTYTFYTGDVTSGLPAQPDGTVTNSSIGGQPTNASSFTKQSGSTGTTSFGSSNLGTLYGSISGGLDFFRVPQSSNQANVTYEGRFTLDTANNTITFTPAVPEPGTAFLLGSVMLGFAARRVRRRVV